LQEPFQHESLLVDRKEKKLSQAEKRLAKRSYELEKQANINYSHRPQYSYYPGSTTAAGNPGMQGTGLQIRSDVMKNIFCALCIASAHSRVSNYVILNVWDLSLL
jgi:RAD54-like protein 2